MDTSARPALFLAVAGAMLLMAGGYAVADGEDEFEAANALKRKGDHVGALRKWREAAEKGHAKAMFSIGVIYSRGQDVQQDNAEALRWYTKAADKGYARAMYAIGFLYDNGQGVKQDYAEALRWYGKAAGKGHAGARAALQRLRKK